jgi:signal transduction histidine kinase
VFRHIRYKLIAAFALPLLILVGVAGLEVSSSVRQISSVNQESSLAKASVGPGGAVQALQNEREDAVLSVLAAAHNLPAALQGITPSEAGITQTPAAVQTTTDNAFNAFRATVDSYGDQSEAAYETAFVDLGLLHQARAEWAAAGTNTSADYRSVADELYTKYTSLIGSLVNATSQVPYQITDPTLRTGVEALVTSLQKTEADWQVTMDLFRASWSPRTAQAAAVSRATQDLGAEQTWVTRLNNLATGTFKNPVGTLVSSTLSQSLSIDVAMVQQGTPPSVPALLESFDESAAGGANRSASNNTVVQQGNAEIASIVYQRAAQLHSNAIRQAAEFGLAGLVGTLLGLVLLALVSRSISRPLARLAHQADELASVYLPATLNAMLTNETGSIPEGLPITVSGQDEVSEVARALDAVQKTAIELGAGQVVLRRNLSDAFVNLGRRTQNLVTRQLEYISDIELKEADPDSLEELFRLDHLATRMRRNAESLLILAGSGPARQWTAAVPAMDVARAASAEVEDYKRLRLHHFDPAMITGEVTTDLVHILAELTENALSFSPPGSPVDVYGRFLEGGYVLVVVDSGIGMSANDLDIANQRLEGLGSEEDVPGRYLGHFVAGRLAARHGLSISVQASHSGGLVARVRIPGNLLEEPVADLSAMAEIPSALATAPAGSAPPVRVSPGPVDGPMVPGDPVPNSANGHSAPPLDGATTSSVDDLPEAWYMNYTGSGRGADEADEADEADALDGANAPVAAPGPPVDTGAMYTGDAGGTDKDVYAIRDILGTGPEDVALGELGNHDYSVGDILASRAPDAVNGLDGTPEAPDGLLPSPDLSDADLESLSDDAEAWSTEVSPPVVPEQPGASLSAPTLPPVSSAVAAPGVDRGWDPLAASPGIGHAPVPPEAAAVPGATSGPTEVAQTYSATGPDPSAVPPLVEPAGSVGPIGAAPRHQGTPDLGILSPLAGTVPAGGLLAWAQSASRSADQAPPKAAALPGPAANGTAPPLAPLAPPAPVVRLTPLAPSPLAPAPAPAPTAAAWNALPAYPPVNGVGPATQARSTADGLRKLTRRVPGASLPEQDDSLRRATPTTTNRNPLGLTGALAQYLSATANDGRAEKEQNPR